MKEKTDKVVVYLFRDFPDSKFRVVGIKEAAKRLHVTPTHVRRIVVGERKHTAAFDLAVTIKEIAYHE